MQAVVSGTDCAGDAPREASFPPVEPPGSYAGAKLAFGRMPDARDFDAPPPELPDGGPLASVSPV